MRRPRTIYFNDARHYYLFVFEPPMALEDAWRPIDEVAGTAVDTFVYGVSRADGLFYPSRVGTQFKHGEHGMDSPGFKQNAYWRVWHNMKSLEERGLDPLRVLVDRAHDKGMDFFASLRLAAYATMDPSHETRSGGRGWVHEEVRDFQYEVLKELTVDYPTEGVELDFAAAPQGSPPHFRDEDDAREYAPALTEWVTRVSDMVRGRPGSPGQVGARVYLTEELNRRHGFDVGTWLAQGSVDFVVPMLYGHHKVDPNLDIAWIIEAAHQADVAVYPMVGPTYRDGRPDTHATPAMMRATVANYRDQGADGTYTSSLQWPLGETERHILTEMADPDLIAERDKHYVFGRRTAASEAAGLATPLPLTIEAADRGTEHGFRFYVSDDMVGKADRIRQVRLKALIKDLVSEDKLSFHMNGASLAGEQVLRSSSEAHPPYYGQWLEFDLETARPGKGWNQLAITLERRPHDLISPLVVEEIELIVEYGPYPSKLDYTPSHTAP